MALPQVLVKLFTAKLYLSVSSKQPRVAFIGSLLISVMNPGLVEVANCKS